MPNLVLFFVIVVQRKMEAARLVRTFFQILPLILKLLLKCILICQVKHKNSHIRHLLMLNVCMVICVQALIKRTALGGLDSVAPLSQSPFALENLQHHSSLRRRLSPFPDNEAGKSEGLRSLELYNKAREALCAQIQVGTVLLLAATLNQK